MISPLALVVSIIFSLSCTDNSDLELVRANYNKVLSDKALCKKIIMELKDE